MPNTLDFDVVFNELTRLQETGNIGVLSAIVTVLLLYLLVVVFARRADKRDKAKVKIKSLCYHWQLFNITSARVQNGRKCPVCVVPTIT